MNKEHICECCQTNPKKAKQARYCASCSEHICNIILQRAHRIDARYKKIFNTLYKKLQTLTEEDYFLSNNLKELIETEQVEIEAFECEE